MAKQIKRVDISEEDLFKSVRDSAESTLKKINELNVSLKESAAVLKKDLLEGNAESAKGIEKLTQATNEARKAKEAAVKLDQEQIKVEQQLIKMNQELEKLEQQKIKTEREAIKNAQILEKEQQKAIKASQDETNVYKQKSALLNTLRNEYKNLAAQNKANTAEAKDLLNTVSLLDDELKAIDQTVGQHQRNVGNYESATKSLKLQLRELTQQLQQMDATDPRFQQMAQEAAVLKDQIDDTGATIRATTGNAVENLSGSFLEAGKLGVAAFQGVEASMQLMGVENENVLEGMRRLAAIAALSDSLKALGELDQKFVEIKASLIAAISKVAQFTGLKRLDTVATVAQTGALTAQTTATTVATGATRALSIAMKTLPIVAIIAGIALLAGALYKIVKGNQDAAEAIKKRRIEDEQAAKATKESREAIANESAAFVSLIVQLKATNKNSAERKNLINDINKQYGTTLQNLSDEKSFQEQLNKAVADYISFQKIKFEISKNEEKINRNLITQDKLKTELEQKKQSLLSATIAAEIRKKQLIGQDVNLSQLAEVKAVESLTNEVDALSTELENAEKRLESYGLSQLKLNEQTKNNYTPTKAAHNKEVEKEIDHYKTLIDPIDAYLKRLKDIEKATEDIQSMNTDEIVEVSEEDIFGVKAFEKAYAELEVQLLNSSKTKEEVDNELLQFEYDNLLKRLEQKRAFGKTDLELEKQVAEKRRALAKGEEKTSQELINTINAVADAQKAASDKRMKLIDQEIAAAEKQFDYFQDLAANGNINAKESLAEQQRLIVEANKQKEKEMRRQARIELAVSAYNAYQKNVEDPNVKNPLAKTITDITLLSQFIQNIPAFFDGTEDTGKNGQGVDGRGGFHAVLHPNERVVPKSLNEQIGSLSNSELARIASEYNTGALIRKGEGAMQIGGAWQTAAIVGKLDALEKAIKAKPETNIELGEIVGGAMEIVKTTRKGNDVTYNRYRIK